MQAASRDSYLTVRERFDGDGGSPPFRDVGLRQTSCAARRLNGPGLFLFF